MSVWKNKYVHINEYSRPGLKLHGVKKLIVHWTANPGATAANHFTYFDKSIIAAKRYASAHIFVDKKEALCIVPLNEVAYQANDGSYRGVSELKPNANFLAIGIEMCVEKDGTFAKETVDRAVDVFAELCKTYKLDPMTDIVRHYDVTHKNCPAPWVKDSSEFTAFKKRVAAKLNPPKAKPTTSASSTSTYKVVKGDSLWKIATDNGMTVDKLKSLNKGVKLEPLQIGTVLKLSASKPSSHTVKRGDTLWDIARANGLTMAELKSLNKGKDLEPLQIGTVLNLK